MEQLRRYELLEVIGKGTTGSVHKVARKADGTLFVLKQVALSGFSEAQRDEVLNEAQVLSHVSHPAIVGCLESFVAHDCLCIIMEYADGGDLARAIKARRGELLDLGAQGFVLRGEGTQRRVLHRHWAS